MKTFWILWHPAGVKPPTYRFDTLAAAVQCAESMMDRIGDGTMFVMKAVGGIEIVKKQKYVVADVDKPPKKARVVRSKDR